MIDVRDLTKTYGALQALDRLSFHIAAGDIVGFLGPNGAGKTTTMKILTGYLAPTAGEVVIGGKNILAEPQAVQQTIGYLPENAPAYPEMTVLEYLRFIAGVRQLSAARMRERLELLLPLTELKDRRHQIIATLSRGFKQRLGLVQALIHDPALLILDEPTSGLDPNQIAQIRQLIRDLGKTKTVLLSTHQLSEVEAVCNRVLIVHQGRLAMDGSIAEARRRAGEGRTLLVRGQGATASAVRETLLERIPGLRSVEILEGTPAGWKLRVAGLVEGIQPQVFALAVEQGWTLSEITVEETRLEAVFQQLTAATPVAPGERA